VCWWWVSKKIVYCFGLWFTMDLYLVMVFFTLYVYMFRGNYVGFYLKNPSCGGKFNNPLFGLLRCVVRKVV
jgi:hypothetical protein